ncbi:MAG: CcoQ/FixQ family Cbb3-type cytochrome c oxidase assembly chaperone [Deltaproteobacteria bacterium]
MRSPLLSLPLLALVLFMVVFATIVIRTLRRPAEHFDAEARLPLGNDQENPREH